MGLLANQQLHGSFFVVILCNDSEIASNLDSSKGPEKHQCKYKAAALDRNSADRGISSFCFEV